MHYQNNTHSAQPIYLREKSCLHQQSRETDHDPVVEVVQGEEKGQIADDEEDKCRDVRGGDEIGG